jgi:hypothetical protein
VYVGGTPFDYGRLVERVFRFGEAALLVEHDVELTLLALRQAQRCGCLWSVSPYRSRRNGGLFNRSLGCTRFSAQLMAKYPDAVGRANAIKDHGSVCPPGHWKALDARLHSVLRGEGLVPHIHAEVPHHNVGRDGCACGGEHG